MFNTESQQGGDKYGNFNSMHIITSHSINHTTYHHLPICLTQQLPPSYFSIHNQFTTRMKCTKKQENWNIHPKTNIFHTYWIFPSSHDTKHMRTENQCYTTVLFALWINCEHKLSTLSTKKVYKEKYEQYKSHITHKQHNMILTKVNYRKEY